MVLLAQYHHMMCDTGMESAPTAMTITYDDNDDKKRTFNHQDQASSLDYSDCSCFS